MRARNCVLERILNVMNLDGRLHQLTSQLLPVDCKRELTPASSNPHIEATVRRCFDAMVDMTGGSDA